MAQNKFKIVSLTNGEKAKAIKIRTDVSPTFSATSKFAIDTLTDGEKAVCAVFICLDGTVINWS